MIAKRTAGSEPRDTVNRERVLRAAMELADEGGIESLTMRELGRRLGVEAASLYNHVAGKDDLLDGMVDLVVAEIDLPPDGVDWKEAMRRRAISARDVFARHPWASGLIDSRELHGSAAPCPTPTDPRHAASGRVLARGRRERVPDHRQLHLRLRAAGSNFSWGDVGQRRDGSGVRRGHPGGRVSVPGPRRGRVREKPYDERRSLRLRPGSHPRRP